MSEGKREITVKASAEAPPEEWVVPPHLKGLSCMLCSFPFKDGDTHGEAVTEDGQVTLVCRVKKDLG